MDCCCSWLAALWIVSELTLVRGVLTLRPSPPGAWCVADGKIFMAEGYCVKCKAKKEIADGVEEVMKNGRKAMKGKCPTCGTVMFKILGGKAVAPTTPNTPPPAAN